MRQIVYTMTTIMGFLSLVMGALPHTGWQSRQQNVQNDTETVALYQSLLDLTYPFTIMCVAAHPDDEDRDALTYYRMKYGARTVIVTSTRGEGGQNSQGPELYEDLGIIRVAEMAACARRLDALTFNLAQPDFGFSKSAEETFTRWNRKDALRRLVYAIRLFQPDIIITQHDRKTGHGHHQATRLLIEEAFTLAADRYAYPEQLSARLDPWQPKRLFVRTISQERYDTEFDLNEMAAVRNRQYSRFSYEALLEHKTQSPWPQPNFDGERMARYNLVKGGEEEFRRWYLLGQGLTEYPIYARIQPLIFDERAATPQQAIALPRAQLVTRLTNALNNVHAYLKGEGKGDRKAQELAAKLQRALLIAAKISFTLKPAAEKTTQGRDFNLTATLVNQGTLSLQCAGIQVSLPNNWEYQETTPASATIEPASQATAEFNVKVGAQADTTLPTIAHFYDLDFLQPQITALAKLSWPELAEPILLPAQARIEVAAAVELEIRPNNIPINVINSAETNAYPFQVRIINNTREPLQGRISVEQGQAVRVVPEAQRLVVAPFSDKLASFLITVGRPVAEGKVTLPVTFYNESGLQVADSALVLNTFSVRVASNLRVGYLRTFDFTLPQALQLLNVSSTQLSVEDIAAGGLAGRFDTIVIDNRAYLAYTELAKVNTKLLDFVKDGGTLIVWYQRPAEWNRATFSPYPIKLGDQRITDEAAPVTILQPEHPLMVSPNKITANDFNNWVQERGLSFPTEWDEKYQALLASADEGEEQLKGGLLVAPYGRGQYIYTSYVVYRQLRAFHGGGYRLFTNMISLPRTR
ncbi:MAG: PIG-L family deacetylase [Acidobacteriota bacterium]